MADTSITLSASAASGTVTVTASSALFVSGDVGRMLAIKQEPGQRGASTVYGAGTTFWCDDRGVRRLYRVITTGTTAATNMAGTTPDYDQNVPTGEGVDVVDGTAVLRYLGRGKSCWGWGRITGYTSSTQVTVVVQDFFTASSPSKHWRLGAWGGDRGWPSTVTFYQGRTVWGGSTAQPQTIWASQSGDYENMAPDEPDGAVLDTNAIVLTLDDDEVQTIRWLCAQQRGVIVGTVGGEWLFGPASETSKVITPANTMARRYGGRGSSDEVAGIRVDSAALYVQRGKQKVRELVYDFGQDAYSNGDVTILAEHITGTGVIDAAYTRSPDGVLWLVREDGLLCTMTYDREQEVRAWSRHAIAGGQLAGERTEAVVESVCAVPSPDGTTDDLYMVVRREWDSGVVRTVEVLRAPFREDRDGQDAAFYVDCGLTYEGTPISTVSGLDHLEGQEVEILADGATRTRQTVTSGEVTISEPAASTVHVGLGYISRLATLPPAASDQGGPIAGLRQRTITLRLMLHETGGLAIGAPDSDTQVVFSRTPFDLMTQALPLVSGPREWTPSTQWSRTAIVSLWNVGPQPLTIQGLAMDYHVGNS